MGENTGDGNGLPAATAGTRIIRLVAELDGEVSRLLADKEALREAHESLRAEYVLVNEELTARNAELHQARADVAVLEDRVANLEKEQGTIVHLQERITLLQSENDGLARRLAGQERQSAEASEQHRPFAGPPAVPGENASSVAGSAPAITAVTSRPTHPATLPSSAGRHDNLSRQVIDQAVAGLAAGSPDMSATVEPAPHDTDFNSGAGTISFHPEQSLSHVPCASPDEVVEVHASFNTASLNIPGYPPQSCLAYVFGIEGADAREVYVAFYLAESRASLLHVPDAQPGDDATYADVLKSALLFAEGVGFIMERIPLDASAAQRAAALARIPCLAGGE